MRNPYEQPYDDTVCCTCGAKLPEIVPPWTWHDHGFCGFTCAARCTGPLDLRGVEPVVELARLGNGRGPGFEESLIREWRRLLATIPGGLLWLAKRHASDDPSVRQDGSIWCRSWSWRVSVADQRGAFTPYCVAFRLTSKVL